MMATSLLVRLQQRGPIVWQGFSDMMMMRFNSSCTLSTIFRHHHQRDNAATINNQAWPFTNILVQHSGKRYQPNNGVCSHLWHLIVTNHHRHFTMMINDHSELIEFKNLSATNKRNISKTLGLKTQFLQETNIFVTKNLKHVVLHYGYFDQTGIISHQAVHFPLGYFATKRSLTNEKLMAVSELDKNIRFMFFHTDNNFLDLLSNDEPIKSTEHQEESLTIFDNPFSALAFHQQTNLPVVVCRFALQSNNGETTDLSRISQRLMSRYKHIYYWSNDVDHCRHFRERFMPHLDASRVLMITKSQDALDMLRQDSNENFASIFFETATLVDSVNIAPVAETRDNLYQHLNDPAIHGTQWLRFPRLNEHLKGHRPGELTIITGPTGSGKTTFVSEYSLDLCLQGVPTLWGSFELKYLALERIMMTQLIGRFNNSNRAEFDAAFDVFSQMPLYFLKFHGQTEIEVVLEEARHAVLRHGVRHLVIDNLQFMLGLSADSSIDRFYKQDLVLGTIREFVTKYQCHVTLVAHPRKEKEEMALSNNSLYGGIKASQEADNILIIMNKYNPRFKCNKYVQITKNRAHGNLGVVPLYFDKNNLSFSSQQLIIGQSADVQEQQQQQQVKQNTMDEIMHEHELEDSMEKSIDDDDLSEWKMNWKV